MRKTGPQAFFPGFDLCDVTLSDLYGSEWPLIEFLSPEMESASPKKNQNDYCNISEMFYIMYFSAVPETRNKSNLELSALFESEEKTEGNNNVDQKSIHI